MKKIIFYLSFLSYFTLTPAFTLTGISIRAEDEPIKDIFKSVPQDLKPSILLVPKYDIVPSDIPNASRINRSVKEGNAEILRIVKKSYSGKYKMVSLKEVGEMKASGSRYFLDMVVMPKQRKEPKKEAMIATYQKFKTANEMFANYDVQFHYYFYIRDLQTEDAYITKKFHGRFLAYEALEEFLKQANREM